MKEQMAGNAPIKSSMIIALILFPIIFLVGCKFPVLHSSDPQPPIENLGKDLRPKNGKFDFGSGLDSKAKDIESNLGYH